MTQFASQSVVTAPEYARFLQSKSLHVPETGFHVAPEKINSKLFDWQREVVSWALKRGKAALFEDCGLGKSAQSLEWANQVCGYSDAPALILTPLAVACQFADEAAKFGIEARVVRSQKEVSAQGIHITNYEMLDAFDVSRFAGVVLDESSILKSFMGVTKRKLENAFAHTPFRLCCTATPSPNDQMELGNHSQFLGIMPSDEILGRWFINDTMNFGKYRIKGHAASDYWEFVASWAMCLSTPADIGFDGSDYVLPKLSETQHLIETDLTQGAEAALFRSTDLSATGLHKELRITAPQRCQIAAELANSTTEPFVVWCNANYEADELRGLIPDAVEVRGSDSVKDKERKLRAFADGTARVIITKPSVAGFGLNWQHCNQAVFVGLSYSYEAYYQALRRVYRFGQKREVEAHIILAQTERAILETVKAKAKGHSEMQRAMQDAMKRAYDKTRAAGALKLRQDAGNQRVALPAWL